MRRPVIFVMLAGVAALVAAIVVYSALKKREAAVDAATVKSTTVVVAAHDLPIGSKIDASALKTVRWAKDDMPPGAFTEPGPLLNQFTRTSFVQNEPIVGDRLFSGDKNAGVLPLLIPNGMRAVSVPVDEVADIAGFVLPHARVDILVAIAGGGSGGGQQFSKTVLQNVEVLAVAQEVENTNADKPEVVHVVTLLVTPEEAEKLVLASHEGTLRMAMRNYDDKKVVVTNGVDVAQLLRGTDAPPLIHQAAAPAIHTAAQPKPVQVEILRNGKSVEDVSFVHSHSSGSSSRSKTDGTETSAADESSKVANADDGASHQAPPAGLEAGAIQLKTDRSANSESVDVAAPSVAATSKSEIAATDKNTDKNASSGPHAKTIDVP